MPNDVSNLHSSKKWIDIDWASGQCILIDLIATSMVDLIFLKVDLPLMQAHIHSGLIENYRSYLCVVSLRHYVMHRRPKHGCMFIRMPLLV